MLNYCVSYIYFNYILKSMILKAICLYCTWHILLSRDMYINWSKRNIWHFHLHIDIKIGLWTSKCIMIFESRAQMTGIYLSTIFCIACELEFLICISIYVFSIHFINFIRFAYCIAYLHCVRNISNLRGKDNKIYGTDIFLCRNHEKERKIILKK